MLKQPWLQFWAKFKMRYWGVHIGNDIRFLGVVQVINMNHIEIGDRTRIISDGRNGVGAWVKTHFETGQNGKIIIGKNVGISNATLISQIEIRIDDFVLVGGGTRIYDNDFHSLDFKTRIDSPTKIPSAAVHIKEGAFIGGHSTILKGVTIGKNSVIGACSLIVKDIPDNELWAGVPAEKIREL